MKNVIELTNEELDLVAGGISGNQPPPPTSATFAFNNAASGPNNASVSTTFNESSCTLERRRVLDVFDGFELTLAAVGTRDCPMAMFLFREQLFSA